MNKVRPGEPVRGRLEARTHNTLLDVAEDYRRNRGKLFDPKAIGGDGVLPALTVSAYRDTGDGDLGEQCPCVLRFTDGADPGLQDPTQNVLGYMRRPTVYALSPTTGDEAEAIGITARAIPEGQFGPVYVSGVVLCTVNVSSTGHEYATLTNNATYLASATSGPAKILWKETASTGSQLCLVLLNGGLSAAPTTPTLIAVDNVHVTANLATTPATYTVKRVERNGSGVLVESSPTVTYTAYEARNDQEMVVDPTSTPTHEIPLFIDDNGNYYIELGQYAFGSDYDTAAVGAEYWPGIVSTTSQIFTGNKSFTNAVTAVQFVAENAALTHSTTVAPTAVSVDGTFASIMGGISYPSGLVEAGSIYGLEVTLFSPTASSVGVYTLLTVDDDSFSVINNTAGSPTMTFYHYGVAGAGTKRLQIPTGFIYSVGTADGLSATYTFGGGATGDVASMTFTGGILTAVTTVP